MADAATLRTQLAALEPMLAYLDSGDAIARPALLAQLEAVHRAAAGPAFVVSQQRLQILPGLAIVMAIEMGLFRALIARQQSETGVASTAGAVLAAQLAADVGFDEVIVRRVMRLICAIGFADELAPALYRANAISALQACEGHEAGMAVTQDWLLPVGVALRDFVRTHKPLAPAQKADPFTHAYGMRNWDMLRARPDWKAIFDNYMTVRNRMLSRPLHDFFPLRERLGSRGDAVVVDIGGNEGVDLAWILEAWPAFPGRLVLQDLPETIARVDAADVLDRRIERMVYDAFTPQPIKGADIYYIKSVLHDFDDSATVALLSQTAGAMGPASRLLIKEMVMAEAGETMMRASMDLLMLLLLGGAERTLAQWVDLLGAVTPRLRLVKVWTAAGDGQGVIEAVLDGDCDDDV